MRAWLACWTCVPLIRNNPWRWHSDVETCRRSIFVINCILLTAFAGWCIHINQFGYLPIYYYGGPSSTYVGFMVDTVTLGQVLSICEVRVRTGESIGNALHLQWGGTLFVPRIGYRLYSELTVLFTRQWSTFKYTTIIVTSFQILIYLPSTKTVPTTKWLLRPNRIVE